MKHFKFFLSFLVALMTGASSSVWAAVGDTFTATTREGVPVTYKVLTESGTTGTVQTVVPDGQYTAIPQETTGTVTIPETVTYGGINYSVTVIGWYSFFDCYDVNYFDIPSTVSEIENGAFIYCSGITTITIPDAVESIGVNAFFSCERLKTVTCNRTTPPTLGIGCFDYIGNLPKLFVPEGCVSAYQSDDTWSNFFARILEIGDNTLGTGDLFTINDANSGVVMTFEIEDLDNNPSVTVFGYSYDSSEPVTLEIPGTISYNGKTFSVTGVAPGCFMEFENLFSVKIPNTVTYIGSGAFYDCTNLETIEFPNSVTNIGYGAFEETGWFENQDDGMVYAGFVAYLYKGEMPSNTSIELIDGTKGIADWAFEDCSELTSITIPNTVIHIGEGAFSYCSGLTNVSLPNNITTIEESTFADCSSLLSIIIPNSVNNIRDYAFAGCSNLATVTCYAETPPTLGEDAFSDIANNPTLYVKESALESYLNSEWFNYFIKIRVIGDTSTGVGDVFTAENAQGVSIVYMIESLNPNTVKTYGYWDNFTNCPVPAIPSNYQGPLAIPETVTFGDVTFTVTAIGEGSFDAYNLDLALTEVILPSTITAIGDDAFGSCSSITKMNVLAIVPPNLAGTSPLSLAEDAVLYVPEESVKSYQNSDWAYYFGGGILSSTPFVAEVGKKFVVPSVEGIDVTYQITSLDEEHQTGAVQLYGWYDGMYLENDYVRFRHENAINNVELVENLTIPSTVKFGVGDDEFTYTVTAVGDYAFLFLKIPTNDWNAIVLPTGSELYSNENRCARIYLPSTITRIGKNAFSAKEGFSIGLKYVALPDGVEEIDDFAFEGAFFLKQLTLPKSLKRIGRSAFEDCNRFEKVTVYNPIPIEPTVWSEYEVDPLPRYAFNNRPQNAPTLYVPYGSKKKYLNSGNWGFHKLTDGTYDAIFFKNIEMMNNKDDDVTTIEPEDEYSTEFAEEMVDGDEVLDLEDAVAGGVYYNLKEDYENGFDDVESCIVINNSSDMSGVSGDFDRAFLVENEYSGLVVEVKGKGIVMIDCKTLGSGKLTVRIGDGSPTAYSQDEKGVISINFDVSNPTPIYIYATGIGEQSVNASRMYAPRRSVSAGDNCVKIYSLSVVPEITFSISDVGMGTFACNSALDFTELEDVAKVYYATYDEDTSTLTFHQILKVPAHTGVLLVSTDGGAVSNQQVPVLLEGEKDEVLGNVFVQGIGEAVSYSEDEHIYDYILYNGDSGLGFYKANKNPVATNRAYVHIPYYDNSEPMVNHFAINLETNGIHTVTNGQVKVADGPIYNLAGQRLSTLQRGINIVNGKKVFVK